MRRLANVVIEGESDREVAARLLLEAGIHVGAVFVTTGKARLDAKLRDGIKSQNFHAFIIKEGGFIAMNAV